MATHPTAAPARPLLAACAAMLSAVTVVAGCSAGADVGTGKTAAPAGGAASGGSLAGVCPATVVVQTAWMPEAEHGALYHLVGAEYRIDPTKKRVTGPLTVDGKDTGVKIEVRAGGPAIGFQNAGSQMYADPDIMLGQVSTDDAIGLSAKQPVLAVVAPFEIAPYVIMWDPKAHPDFHSVIDVGKSRSTKVVYFNGATYMEYLIGSGILRREQADGSYDGSPTRWLAEDGRIAQQGFATSEPYIYEKSLPGWKRPVQFQLIHDTGYPIYPESVVIRADRKQQYAACLKKLVPIIQRSQADFVKNSASTVDLIIKVNDAYKGYPYSAGLARFSVDQQLKLGIVSSGPNGTLGDFDEARVAKVISIVKPIYDGQRKAVKGGLVPADLYTNEFIDQSVGLG